MNDATKQVLDHGEQEVVSRAERQLAAPIDVTDATVDGLLRIIDRLCAENAELRKPSQWVKCSERLPDRGRKVLWGNSKTRQMRTGDLPFPQSNVIAHGKHNDTAFVPDWTHWRELPLPPESEE